MFLKKLTNWSSHKLENRLEWSILSIQQANFINFNPIEQNPKIGFNTSPRIFNLSQSPKLIKLINIYHEYNYIRAKPNDQFQKKRIDSKKIPNMKSFENPIKKHEFMHEIMKIKQNEGYKGLTGLGRERHYKEFGWKRQKILSGALPSRREKGKFEKVFWMSQTLC